MAILGIDEDGTAVATLDHWETNEPHNCGHLLIKLRVLHAPYDVQLKAIEAYLESHQASPRLMQSLVWSGFVAPTPEYPIDPPADT